MDGSMKTEQAGNTLPRPLDDITVLDMTVALAGPFATLLLAGLGAHVIKVENPANGDTCRENAPYLGAEGASLVRRGPDDISVSAINRLRNKLGITLNLKHPEGRSVFADLLKRCDVLVENYSRGTLDRLGVGYGWIKSSKSSAGLLLHYRLWQRRRFQPGQGNGHDHSGSKRNDVHFGRA